ncbi:hypothetical protein A3E39_01065 [Candidatus Uhrbacteria bacterium RIFCSPHIGHO2_12_FULL_60_25]|uniref:Uncharacterized protein n=1 Tax=Candidatus Uhrbacteria bacterium RIFCSPHIGHO2_12_FULL_60_25 TaxID=1802399 RepID=A0A1F7UKG2_9BACT|nr:MAG: hypothetical protein A3D73_02420 [Candidatus Uhrbacteria bacterium RIFCSPHIGHO2_02_FULL_60_44]OGL78735.1 MAG: hypothetical protein A3E39_01065 [Candidatus Uhrbacteria bacterium RIFCSPHIGHO2_12_FULL_60_25]
MVNLDTLNRGELYNEIAELARSQGVANQDMWNQLCDEVIESHFSIGEMEQDQDFEGLRAALHAAWEEYRIESAPESDAAVAEDPDAPHD